MNITDLKTELIKNNINLDLFFINPSYIPDGYLCIKKDDENQGWRVIYAEKGNFSINEFFTAQHDACRYFLKIVFQNITSWNDYNMSDKEELIKRSKIALIKYGFNE